ncbi:hypothetical protein HIM_00078 [Hirsutella minnesotensis 3608]|nr:hypothetical protein HIM_00078 [Hirsutella minnesotensis 3608]
MAQLRPYHGHYYLWDYIPSKPAAILFTILFALATIFIVWRIVRTRTLFSIAFAVGGIFELGGYAARPGADAENKTDRLGPFIAQSVLILVAPALFAASIYMTLGRLMRRIHGEGHSLIPVRWLTRAFVAGDVASFLVQSAGGGLMASRNFSQTRAQNIILGGLLVQIVMFGLFAVTAVVFDVRMRRWPSPASLEHRGRPWKRIMAMLYGTTALIFVRSVVRVVEYIMGRSGYLLRNEWTLYVFDAAPMLLTMALYGWIYPGDLEVGYAKRARAWEPASSGSINELGLDNVPRTGGRNGAK